MCKYMHFTCIICTWYMQGAIYVLFTQYMHSPLCSWSTSSLQPELSLSATIGTDSVRGSSSLISSFHSNISICQEIESMENFICHRSNPQRRIYCLHVGWHKIYNLSSCVSHDSWWPVSFSFIRKAFLSPPQVYKVEKLGSCFQVLPTAGDSKLQTASIITKSLVRIWEQLRQDACLGVQYSKEQAPSALIHDGHVPVLSFYAD